MKIYRNIVRIENESLKNRARGCLLGLAVGDAIGTTVEFQARGTFVPVANMGGGGVFNLRAGCWTERRTGPFGNAQ